MHHKLRVLGFRIDDFVYITDVNHIPEEEMKKLKGCDTLVLSALRQTTHISHFSLEQAVELIQRVKPRKGYLTHISHQMGRHKDVSTALPDNVEIAYDGLELTW
jgi:phosphoribosyl 1,2-cyclic phosphate phosphodiesterase